MADKTQKENNNDNYSKGEVTVSGTLRKIAAAKKSVNDNKFIRALLEVTQVRMDGKEIESDMPELILMFWEDKFSEKEKIEISNLEEGKSIVVVGRYGKGEFRKFFQVRRFMLPDEDPESLFIY